MIKVPVLVTAPEGYAQRFAEALNSVADDAFCFEVTQTPMISTVAADGVGAFVEAMDGFDYVVFTSRKAILVLADYLMKNHITAQLPAALAIGKDNEALKLLGTEHAMMADEASLMGIARLLSERCPARVAVLGPEVIGLEEPDTVPDFMAEMKRIGADAVFYVAYRTSAASADTLEHAAQWINKQRGWVAFTSATEAQVFRRVMNSVTGCNIKVACFGPYTAQCVRKEGVNVDFVSPDFSSFAAFAHHLKEVVRV